MKKSINIFTAIALLAILFTTGCKPKSASNAVSGDAAAKAYVAPGKYDEYYNFCQWRI
jgi:nitrous-oxide reductase